AATKVGLRDLKVGDLTLRMGTFAPVEMTLPFMVDGHVVMLIGTELEKQAAAVLTGDGEHFAPPAGATAGTLSAHADIGPILDKVMKLVAEQMEGHGAPFDGAKMVADLGLGCLRSCD